MTSRSKFQKSSRALESSTASALSWLRNALRELELSAHEQLILGWSRDSVRLRSHAGAPKSLVSSHFGGRPSLAAGAAWPRRGEVPLAFVMQINLAELHGAVRGLRDILPLRGLLAFFVNVIGFPSGYSLRDDGAYQVIFSPDPGVLSPRAAPADLVAPAHCNVEFECRAVQYARQLALPPLRVASEAMAPTTLTANAELKERLALHVKEHGPRHRMFGWQDSRRNDLPMVAAGMRAFEGRDADRALIEVEQKNWVLLLQLATDRELGFDWGPIRLQFAVELERAKRGDFSRVWGIQDSSGF